MANKLALEAGIGCRLLLKHLAILWLVRHVAWLMTRYNTGRDGCSHCRRIFGKPYDGSICMFGEQVHYKLSGRPSSRVEPRWELGDWVGKMYLTDEQPLGTLAGLWSSRTIYRLTKSHCYNKDALDRIVETPTNPRPHGAARDPQVRRQCITQRWVDVHGVTPGCPRCEGRGTMSHSEKCRKRFESIGKEKLDKQLEEATRNAEPPLVIAAEMDVEQPREQPSTGGASALALLLKKTKGVWTGKYRNVARKIFLEGGWTQKRLFDIGWSDVSQCQACKTEEGTKKTQALPLSRVARSQAGDFGALQKVGAKSENVEKRMEVAKRKSRAPCQ